MKVSINKAPVSSEGGVPKSDRLVEVVGHTREEYPGDRHGYVGKVGSVVSLGGKQITVWFRDNAGPIALTWDSLTIWERKGLTFRYLTPDESITIRNG